jgi:hypothetical protein
MSPDAIFDYALHHGNVSPEGILKGTRAEEQPSAAGTENVDAKE